MQSAAKPLTEAEKVKSAIERLTKVNKIYYVKEQDSLDVKAVNFVNAYPTSTKGEVNFFSWTGKIQKLVK